jgi:hypothetical protein
LLFSKLIFDLEKRDKKAKILEQNKHLSLKEKLFELYINEKKSNVSLFSTPTHLLQHVCLNLLEIAFGE